MGSNDFTESPEEKSRNLLYSIMQLEMHLAIAKSFFIFI